MAQTQLNVNEPNYVSSLRNKYYPVSISSRAFSEAEKQWLSEHDVLRVGYLTQYLPYSDKDEAGEATGMVKDLVPRMLEGLYISGLEVTYVGFDSYDDMISNLGAKNLEKQPL